MFQFNEPINEYRSKGIFFKFQLPDVYVIRRGLLISIEIFFTKTKGGRNLKFKKRKIKEK